MYICDAEQASLYKQAKENKSSGKSKDRTNSEALEYALWITGIGESVECIRYCGLLPTPRTKRMKKILPDLNSVYNYHIKGDKKHKKTFDNMLTNCFNIKNKYLNTYNARILCAPAHWAGASMPLIGIMKILMGIKLKDQYHGKKGRSKHIFNGGWLVECKDPPFRFHSIKLQKKGGGPQLASSFQDMILIDGVCFLSAFTLASNIFTNRIDKDERVTESGETFRLWKARVGNNGTYYVNEREDDEETNEGQEGTSGGVKWSKTKVAEMLTPISQALNELDYAMSGDDGNDLAKSKINAVKRAYLPISKLVGVNDISWTDHCPEPMDEESEEVVGQETNVGHGESSEEEEGSGVESSEEGDGSGGESSEEEEDSGDEENEFD